MKTSTLSPEITYFSIFTVISILIIYLVIFKKPFISKAIIQANTVKQTMITSDYSAIKLFAGSISMFAILILATSVNMMFMGGTIGLIYDNEYKLLWYWVVFVIPMHTIYIYSLWLCGKSGLLRPFWHYCKTWESEFFGNVVKMVKEYLNNK